MPVAFTSTVSRGEAKGEPMEPWKDEDGNFVLFDPQKRREGGVRADDCVRARTAEQARKLIEERGYSMRMKLRGTRGGPASLIKADRIVVIDISSDA